MEPDKTWLQRLAPDARIYVEVAGRPIERYAVTLQLLIDGTWRTILLLDNAHGPHDLHRYTGATKQPAERFMEGDPRQVLPAAIAFVASHWEAIAESWKS